MASLLAEILIGHLKCKREELLFESIWWDTSRSTRHNSHCLSQSDRTPPEVQDRRVTVWVNLIGHLLKYKTQQPLFESIWLDTSWSTRQKSYCLSQSDRTPPEVQDTTATVWVNLIGHLLKYKTQQPLFESIWSDTSWSTIQKSYCLSQSDRTSPEVQDTIATVWVNLIGHLLKYKTEELLFESSCFRNSIYQNGNM
jgi:nicotinamide mononucleotide adenylyltransferase